MSPGSCTSSDVGQISLTLSHERDSHMNCLNALWNDEAGFIVSAELVLVATVCVLGLVVGLSEMSVSINTELNDLSNAFGSLNQSYSFCGFASRDCGKLKSYFGGSSYRDMVDDGDMNMSCDIVCGGGGGEGHGGHGHK